MATILLTWELGGGIGHLMNLRPIGEELVRRGHRVVAALRDLTNAADVLGSSGIAWMPAPIMQRRGAPRYEPTHGFAEILGNVGFADRSMLSSLFTAWSTILDTVRPNLVVTDHSPTALLALRGRPIRRVNVGLGFFCPPDTFPLPIWSPPQDQRATATRNELEITDTVNCVLTAQRRPPLQRLGQLFHEVDEVFLATYREFDHFGPRPQVRYWGHWPFAAAALAPQWPTGKGPRIYAYLKPFPGLEGLLAALQAARLPTLIFAGGIEPAMQARFASPHLRFEQRPLDLRQVADQCDLAVLMAGHGTTAALLLTGKPCLLVPPYLEQLLFASTVERTGAARVLGKEAGAPAGQLLQEMLNNSRYRTQAQALAARYAGFQPGQQVGEVVDHLLRWC